MKISLCYIVKDEINDLATSVKAIAAAVDEIIIGATCAPAEQAVRELAAGFGARVLTVPWQNDFAAARNAVLAQAAGDWVIFLDADEYFVPGAAEELRAYLQQSSAEGLLFLLHNIDKDRHDEELDRFWALRAFKRRKGRAYQGRIHETVQDAGGPMQGEMVQNSRLELYHTGYAASRSKAKGERNLAMLLEELENSDRREQLYSYLAETYDGLERRQEAMHYARLAVAQGRQPLTYASRCYRILLHGLTGSEALLEERAAVTADAVREFPELPEFHAEMALCHALAYDYQAAVAEAERALQLVARPEAVYEPVQFSAAAAEQLRESLQQWQELADKAAKLKIAACLIMKDEEQDLPDWLKAAKVYADEIVIVDTGSSDSSIALAKAAGAKVFPFNWTDDFAAARNFALAQAGSPDWFVMLDADEYFYRPERLRNFLAEKSLRQPEAETGICFVVNVDDVSGKEINCCYSNARFLRGGLGLRYAGKVHEQAVRKDGTQPVSFTTDRRLALHHTGYSPRRMRAKAERNLKLLLAEKQSLPEGDCRLEGYLATTYFTLEKYQETIECIKRFLAAGFMCGKGKVELWHLYLQSLRELQAPLTDFLSVVEEAIRQEGELAELYAEKGMALSAAGRLEEAEKFLLQALSKAAEQGKETRDGYLQVILPGIKLRLAEVEQRLNKTTEAKNNFREALELNKQDEHCFALYYNYLEKEILSEQIKDLDRIYLTEEQRIFAGQQALRLGAVGLADYYLAAAADEQSRRSLQVYHKAAEQGAEKTLQQAEEQMPQHFRQLCRSLFALGSVLTQEEEQLALWEHALALLPQQVSSLLRCWLDSSQPATADLEDAYIAILPWSSSAGDKGQESFCRLGLNISVAAGRKTIDWLMDEGKWQTALALLAVVPADSPLVDASFWYKTGIVLYRLADYPAAQEAFARAREMGCTAKAMDFYLQVMTEEGQK